MNKINCQSFFFFFSRFLFYRIIAMILCAQRRALAGASLTGAVAHPRHNGIGQAAGPSGRLAIAGWRCRPPRALQIQREEHGRRRGDGQGQRQQPRTLTGAVAMAPRWRRRRRRTRPVDGQRRSSAALAEGVAPLQRPRRRRRRRRRLGGRQQRVAHAQTTAILLPFRGRVRRGRHFFFFFFFSV